MRRREAAYAARVEVVVSEPVTNAVCHALPDVRITWQTLSRDRRPHVRVEVGDAGPSGDPSARADHPERGLGSRVMRALAAEHGTTRCPNGGTLRWVEIAAP